MTDAAAPRLAPLSLDEMGDDVRAALEGAYPAQLVDRFLSAGPDAYPMPNALGTFMRHPALTGPFLAYNNVLLGDPALGARARELVVLRVAWLTRCRYEWLQHVRLAAREGITTHEIAAVAEGPDAAGWAPLDADLLRATDQLIDHYRVDDDTWARLAEALDDRRLIELVFVVGTYTALAMVFRSFGLQLDPGLEDSTDASLPEFEE